MVRLEDSMSMGPMLQCFGCEVSSLTEMMLCFWDILRVKKTFRKFMAGSFSRRTMYREGKLITRVNICSSKDKMLPFP